MSLRRNANATIAVCTTESALSSTNGEFAQLDMAKKPELCLHSLSIFNFRNIESASLSFCGGLNLLHGKNGSGKTSLMEAIYCLGRVRSFRTHHADQLIRYGQSAYQLIGHITGQGGQLLPLGIERSRSELTVHFDGENVLRLSDLAGNFPVLVLSADNMNIINGGPRFRRHTLDWALFHVEPNYRELWQRYSRALRQRNAALKSHCASRLIKVWDEDLLDAGIKIDRLRREYLVEFSILLRGELDLLLPGIDAVLRYHAGWPANSSLQDSLSLFLDKDRASGFTQYGVHRSDFRILVNHQEFSNHCSRGQQKVLLVAFLLAQIRLQRSRQSPLGSFLFDDLSSELDESAQQRVLQALRELGIQAFVSQIAGDREDYSGWSDFREFHVEHGIINEVL